MNLLENFREHLFDDDKSENTINSYLSDIKIFETFIKNGTEKTNAKEIKNYMSFLEAEGQKPGTINRKIASIKAYINYLNINGHNIDLSRLKKIKICVQEFLEDSLTEDEVKRIIKYAEKSNDLRALCIIKMLLFTGGRVSEILQIKVSDVDKNGVTIKGKGGKYRQLLISKKLSTEIKRYLTERNNNSKFLFTGQRGSITRNTVNVILKKYAGKARIKLSKVHAHSFRHLYSRLLEKKGVSYTIIQQLLGHSLTVTMGYTQVDRKELMKIINSIKI